MPVYFSHSYRDVAINSYFLDHFVREEITLDADQKSDVWCVAKLERCLLESTAFVSVIPRRATEQDAGAYSAYIGQELNLARRARVPRLVFVDEKVLHQHALEFPEDAVAFRPDALEQGQSQHANAIGAFRQVIEIKPRSVRQARPNEVTVVAGKGTIFVRAAEDITETLKRDGYSVTLLRGPRRERGLDDIRLLERLWRSELCVFILEDRLSETHMALAMAHTDCIPSFRLQYDKKASDTNPSISGLIRWRSVDDMLLEFRRQLTSYREGLVQPVEIARASSSTEAMRSTSTMKWSGRADNYWDVGDGPALVRHVQPDHLFVQDEVNRVRRELRRSLGQRRDRENSNDICRGLYDGIRRYRFGYELEPPTGATGRQIIRSPSQIATHKTANCLDLACLFASLLEAAGQNALVLVLEGTGFAHAVAGYRAPDEPACKSAGLGDLRGSLARGDVVLFEPTGAVESDRPVSVETAQERQEKLLDFSDAQIVAGRLLGQDGVRLKYLVDVRALRTAGQQNR
ncbi:MAG TPA: hypothetical protein VJ801_13005 [Polyangia bacterium]|nr:hypothetical protein [Polyangia bacterium]